jgi:hypothetical protein
MSSLMALNSNSPNVCSHPDAVVTAERGDASLNFGMSRAGERLLSELSILSVAVPFDLLERGQFSLLITSRSLEHEIQRVFWATRP